MAILKHISSKNANYGDAEKYLTFEHDEFTMKPTLDADGRLIPRVCRPLGAVVRAAEKAVGCGELMTCRGAALCRSPAFSALGQIVPK